VRLVQFLILVLETHAQSLQRLAAFFGEEVLFELLEMQEDEPRRLPVNKGYFKPAVEKGVSGQAYGELESAVRAMKLHPVLEFHVWAYPFYRSYIESEIDLNSMAETGTAIVDEAIAEAKNWIHQLPLPPAFAAQAERAAEIPWVKFRANALKKIGKRPLGPVY
jgi:hypothetical protein